MGEDLKQKVIDYLASHSTLALATVTPEGNPLCHTMEYASDGTTIYFGTFRGTRKVVNIKNNPKVAFTVDEEEEDWLQIQGVQLEGIATILTEPAEIEKAAGIYINKFPFVANWPPNPNLYFIKVEPTAGYYLDYSKGFTHKEKVVF